MYDDLIASLRDMSKMGTKYGMAVVKMREAADAIEELQKRVPKTPHGDLIDRDALMKGEGRYIISFGKEGIDVAEINRAPIVLEAEEDE